MSQWTVYPSVSTTRGVARHRCKESVSKEANVKSVSRTIVGLRPLDLLHVTATIACPG
jgi:hypothetical protein